MANMGGEIQVSDAARFTRLLFVAGAVLEIGVGVATIVFPQLLALLLATALDASGLLVARMVGCALLALGTTWWSTRSDAYVSSRFAAGFLIYNLGVGTLFLVHGFSVARPALPWFVAVVHLAAGLGFAALLSNTRVAKA